MLWEDVASFSVHNLQKSLFCNLIQIAQNAHLLDLYSYYARSHLHQGQGHTCHFTCNTLRLMTTHFKWRTWKIFYNFFWKTFFCLFPKYRKYINPLKSMFLKKSWKDLKNIIPKRLFYIHFLYIVSTSLSIMVFAVSKIMGLWLSPRLKLARWENQTYHPPVQKKR